MNDTQQLATVTKQTTHLPAAYIPNSQDWAFMVDWGKQAIRTGMLPAEIKTAEAAALIILKGRELGLPFMVSIAHIHIIKGKPSMSAELMQAQARRNLPGLKINIVEVSSEKAVIKFKRPEVESEWFTSTFTIEDAKRAGLLGNTSWQKYPKSMVFSRAVSAGLRFVCPEALMGVSYTPEELGADVNEEGDVIHTTGKSVTTAVAIKDQTQTESSQPSSAPVPVTHNPLTQWAFTTEHRNELVKLVKESANTQFKWTGNNLITFVETAFNKKNFSTLTEKEYDEVIMVLRNGSFEQAMLQFKRPTPIEPKVMEEEEDPSGDPSGDPQEPGWDG